MSGKDGSHRSSRRVADMASNNAAIVLQQVFDMLKRLERNGVQEEVETSGPTNVQVYHSPTIVQFYFGDTGSAKAGGDDRSAAVDGAPKGYVKDGRVEVPVGHGQHSLGDSARREDDAGAADRRYSVDAAELRAQQQQRPNNAAAGFDGPKTPDDATTTDSMNRRAGHLITALQRGWKLSPRHRRMLCIAALEQPPEPYEEHRRPSSAAQFHHPDNEADVNDADEIAANRNTADLSPESRLRHYKQQYLDQTHGLCDTDDTTPRSPKSKPTTSARNKHIQGSQGEIGVQEASACGASHKDAEEITVSAASRRRNTGSRNGFRTPSLSAKLHANHKRLGNSSGPAEMPAAEVQSLGHLSGAERFQPRNRVGRPQSVHSPKMMPTGTSKNRYSFLKSFMDGQLVKKRNASEAVALEEEPVTSEQSEQVDGDAAGDSVEGLRAEQKADRDDEDEEEIQVHRPRTKKRKISSESSDEEVVVSEQMRKLLQRLTAARTTERAIFEAQISSHSADSAGIEAMRLDYAHRKAKAYRKRVEKQIEKQVGEVDWTGLTWSS